MIIVYISNLSNNIDAGLNWSVPAGVKAQQRYDDVLWLDLTNGAYQKHWGEVDAYHNIKDYGGELRLSVLPNPFSRPDYVVFEGFYYLEHVRFARELQRNKVPYIIIPRGSLTAKALKLGDWKKRLKKKLAHRLLFNRYIHEAAFLQYLTAEEAKESCENFKTRFFILPNGFSTPRKHKEVFSNGIKALFIGRLDIHHKGLDLLLNAIKDIKSELETARFTLDIYGAPRYDVSQITGLITKLDLSNLVTNHARAITGDEKERIILQSDVFVLTSRFEGHPMGLIEALAYGLPVLVTRGSNMFDEVCDSHSGWVSETSIEGIKRSLQQMIADKEKYSDYSKNALLLSSRYDWDKLAERFHNYIQSALDNNENGYTINE